jgi:hypothetical protein
MIYLRLHCSKNSAIAAAATAAAGSTTFFSIFAKWLKEQTARWSTKIDQS